MVLNFAIISTFISVRYFVIFRKIPNSPTLQTKARMKVTEVVEALVFLLIPPILYFSGLFAFSDVGVGNLITLCLLGLYYIMMCTFGLIYLVMIIGLSLTCRFKIFKDTFKELNYTLNQREQEQLN